MDYHKHRFDDNSFLILDKSDNIIALLPANKNENILYSHQGLTYGGLVIKDRTNTEKVLEIFQKLIKYLKKNQFNTFIYKKIPYI